MRSLAFSSLSNSIPLFSLPNSISLFTIELTVTVVTVELIVIITIKLTSLYEEVRKMTYGRKKGMSSNSVPDGWVPPEWESFLAYGSPSSSPELSFLVMLVPSLPHSLLLSLSSLSKSLSLSLLISLLHLLL